MTHAMLTLTEVLCASAEAYDEPDTRQAKYYLVKDDSMDR
jgi:hypothetical protein